MWTLISNGRNVQGGGGSCPIPLFPTYVYISVAVLLLALLQLCACMCCVRRMRKKADEAALAYEAVPAGGETEMATTDSWAADSKRSAGSGSGSSPTGSTVQQRTSVTNNPLLKGKHRTPNTRRQRPHSKWSH